MASLTIRKLSENAKSRLRVRAARAGRSMEEEARRILEARPREAPPVRDLAGFIIARTDPVGGFELPVLPRDARQIQFVLDELDESSAHEERLFARRKRKASR